MLKNRLFGFQQLLNFIKKAGDALPHPATLFLPDTT
jgi:p-aminobenzoyl-glutamate transporter AbgT